MRVDGSMPSGAPKTSSTTVKESVSSNGQSSDFNKVLKSSVKSNNNFDKASKSSIEKNSTYSQNNIKSKNSDDTKNLVKNEVSKSKDISLDNGKKSNKIADKTKKNTDDNLALKNTSNVKDNNKDTVVVNYDLLKDLNEIKIATSDENNSKLTSAVENVISNVKEKSEKLDVNSILAVLNQITEIINSKVENTDNTNNLLKEINSILDNKISESKDSILSFFQSIDNNNNSMEDVLSTLENVLKNSDDTLVQDDKKGILAVLESLENKIVNNKENNNIDKAFSENESKASNDILGEKIDSNNFSEVKNDIQINTEGNNITEVKTTESNSNLNTDNIKNINAHESKIAYEKENINSSNAETLQSEVKENNKELITQIKNLLNENEQVSNLSEVSNNDNKQIFNNKMQNIISKNVESKEENIDVKNYTSSDSNNSSNNFEESKDEKILKSILNDKDLSSTTINRNVTFAGTFNNVNALDGLKEAAKLVKAEHLAEDIIQSVKYMETNNIKELTVKINPRNLGELSIKVIQEDGVLKAQIKATTKEGYDLLSRNASIINKELSNQNLKIQNVNISLNNDTTFFKGSSFEGNANNFSQNEASNKNAKNNVNGVLDEDEVLEDNEAEIINNINMLA
ncbi:MAG: flagellar hook-length control protein FliK [Clostridium sp.]|nr:flagellar hook-length control protein FliK [Clostridium sp.]